MEDILNGFFTRISATGPADERALVALDAFTQLVGARSSLSRTDPLVQATVHVRTNDSYQVLVSRGDDAGELSAQGIGSATLWRWVHRLRATVGLDVCIGCIHACGPGGGALMHEELDDEQLESSASLRAMIDRDATHILAAPLVGARGELIGMFTLELQRPDAIGVPTFWDELFEPVTLLARILGPHLGALSDAPALESAPIEPDPLLPVVGASMRRPIGLARRFASQRETLLVSGPSGAGKTRLARWCHAHSAERDGPFEVLDLLTVPESMQMAELVGWRKGAFTGATQDVEGAIARAHGGTLFLDEIDKLSLKTQAGLLRLLEEGTYRALGDRGGARAADVRFIVGTNRSLGQAVEEGTFREDLFWRINVLPITLPSLDERADEIVPWARHMLERVAAERGVGVGWDPDALELLRSRSWPGNLRQLDNIVRRSFALALTGSPSHDPVVRITREHVVEGMGLEHRASDAEANALLQSMRRAACAFADQARRGALTLEHAAVFRGYVLREAAGEDVDYAGALSALGQQSLVSHRNHHRLWSRENERVDAFEALVLQEVQEDDDAHR